MYKRENGKKVKMTAEEIAELQNSSPEKDEVITQLDIIEQIVDLQVQITKLEINQLGSEKL